MLALWQSNWGELFHRGSFTQTGFDALRHTTSSPTGLLGVGLDGKSSRRMIAF